MKNMKPTRTSVNKLEWTFFEPSDFRCMSCGDGDAEYQVIMEIQTGPSTTATIKPCVCRTCLELTDDELFNKLWEGKSC